MTEKIDDADYWKAKALATAAELAQERATRAIADFQTHMKTVREKNGIRDSIDELREDGTIVRGKEEAK